LGGKIIVVGAPDSKVRVFDPVTEELTELNVKLPINRTSSTHMHAVSDNRALIFGGFINNKHQTSVDELILGFVPVVETDTLQVQSTLDKNIFNLINTDTIKAEIGVNAVYKGNADGVGEQVEAALHNGTDWVTI
jgi:hypothetical protein